MKKLYKVTTVEVSTYTEMVEHIVELEENSRAIQDKNYLRIAIENGNINIIESEQVNSEQEETEIDYIESIEEIQL